MSEAAKPCAVLVVDDDYGIREVLTEVLVDAGYATTAAPDGSIALEYLQQAPELPRVILLDLMMPVMTGWEFRLAQQQDPRLAAIPVVALSARRNLDHQHYTVTVNDFMQKPVDLDQLLNIVERYCGVAD